MDRSRRKLTRRKSFRASSELLEGRMVLSAAAIASTDAAGAADTAEVARAKAAESAAAAAAAAAAATTTTTVTSAHIAAQQIDNDATPAIVDTSNPAVTGTQMLTRGNQVVGFVVHFSKAMDQTAVTDVRNFHAYQVTQPNKFLARLLYQSDKPQAKSMPIRSVVYDSDAHTATLLLAQSRKTVGQFRVELLNPATPKGPVLRRLNIPALTDTGGRPILGIAGPRGRRSVLPIMLRPGSRIQLDGLPAGTYR